MKTIMKSTHVYHTALAPTKDWTPSQINEAQQLNLSFETLNENEFPNQPDTLVYGSFENIKTFIESIYFDSDDIETEISLIEINK